MGELRRRILIITLININYFDEDKAMEVYNVTLETV